MEYDVFISYSRRDTKIAEAICNALSDAGISFFIDKEGISAGANFPEVLARTIDSATVFLLVASENAYKSKFTKAEILYAFNHKRSGCIIPYLVDECPMPSDLEFLLGNVNWLYAKNCPVTGIPAEVQKALDNPDQGTIAGRKVKKLWFLWLLIPIIFGAVGYIAYDSYKNHKVDEVKQAEDDAAVVDLQTYEELIRQSDSLVSAAGILSRKSNTIETTAEQIQDLQQASALLKQSDSLKAVQTDLRRALFNVDLAPRQRKINAKLDSMHVAWTEFAKDSWSLYKVTRSKSDAKSTLECIDHALSIKPNSELETIKTKISR